MSLRRFYPPCFLSIGAEDHDTWRLPERMYLEHLSDNHIPKAGIGHLLDRPVEIRWWHLLADPDRMTCQGQDRCCRYTPSTAYLETATGTAECNLGIHHLQNSISHYAMSCSHLGEYAHQA